jgi:hypothetical protein
VLDLQKPDQKRKIMALKTIVTKSFQDPRADQGRALGLALE